MIAAPSDPGDPQAEVLAAAEDDVVDEIGPRLRTWVEVAAFVDRVVTSPAWTERFPTAPLEIDLRRRSRSARASLAVPSTATVAIRDGHWQALVVLHELTHLVTPTPPPHGAAFAANELELVRTTCGVHAWTALRRAFEQHGVRHRRG